MTITVSGIEVPTGGRDFAELITAVTLRPLPAERVRELIRRVVAASDRGQFQQLKGGDALNPRVIRDALVPVPG